ncbi:hypothetical protein FRB93_008383 [Tulasnella sp. JGI-2019a]|nr:hypothetical protein FRB93_008383 [Tulasnella sp. JGI-2019a]
MTLAPLTPSAWVRCSLATFAGSRASASSISRLTGSRPVVANVPSPDIIPSSS